jgi:hypothetical protein
VIDCVNHCLGSLIDGGGKHSQVICFEGDEGIFYFLQIPNKFDDETVQRQLRYTGMLETVRIRQAGYNVRLTYDEFIQLYRILLPKGLIRCVLCSCP